MHIRHMCLPTVLIWGVQFLAISIYCCSVVIDVRMFVWLLGCTKMMALDVVSGRFSSLLSVYTCTNAGTCGCYTISIVFDCTTVRRWCFLSELLIWQNLIVCFVWPVSRAPTEAPFLLGRCATMVKRPTLLPTFVFLRRPKETLDENAPPVAQRALTSTNPRRQYLYSILSDGTNHNKTALKDASTSVAICIVVVPELDPGLKAELDAEFAEGQKLCREAKKMQ